MSCSSSDRILSCGRALLTALLVAFTTSCAIGVDLPDGYLRIDSPWGQVKALTPDDSRLWIREFDAEEEATLAFWTEALRNDLVDRRGYVPTSEPEPVTDGDGVEGTIQSFTIRYQGVEYGYLIAVFVDGDDVRTAEFAAPATDFAARAPAIRESLGTIRG
jgi:hypothetical protein